MITIACQHSDYLDEVCHTFVLFGWGFYCNACQRAQHFSYLNGVMVGQSFVLFGWSYRGLAVSSSILIISQKGCLYHSMQQLTPCDSIPFFSQENRAFSQALPRRRLRRRAKPAKPSPAIGVHLPTESSARQILLAALHSGSCAKGQRQAGNSLDYLYYSNYLR